MSANPAETPAPAPAPAPVTSFLSSEVAKSFSSTESSCPLDHSSILSILSWRWVSSLMDKGSQKVLQENDVWPVPKELVPDHLLQKFDPQWVNSVKSHQESSTKKATQQQGQQQQHQQQQQQQQQGQPSQPLPDSAPAPQQQHFEGHAAAGKEDESSKLVFKEEKTRGDSIADLPGLGVTLWRSFGSRLRISAFTHILSLTCLTLQPLFVQALLNFRQNPSQPSWQGYLYCGLLILITISSSVLTGHTFYQNILFGCSIRSALMIRIYRKSLQLSNSARQQSSTGTTVNLMSNDASRCFDAAYNFHGLYLYPIHIIVCLVLMTFQVGPAAYAGVGMMLLLAPLQAKIASKIGTLRRQMAICTDHRVKVMNEILQGVRVVKFYAWEEPFSDKIDGLRLEELRVLKTLLYLKVFNVALSFVWPIFVSLVVFSVYVKSGNTLTVTTAFTVLAYMNSCRFSVSLLPGIVSAWMEGKVSLDRISRFLTTEDLVPAVRKSFVSGTPRIIIKDADFKWNSTAMRPTLSSINLSIPDNALVAVIGHIGCGKSSLLSAMIGEMFCSRGQCDVFGEVSYASQENWIRNVSVKDNILFGLPYDESLYKHVVKASALESDIAILPARDDTEIGERGINLSGGQKARVSIARALYRKQHSQIYILDDPLSAVDLSTGNHIFNECIAKFLADRTRIVVMNSHLHLLSRFDRIIVMEEKQGRFVASMMTYNEVMKNYSSLLSLSGEEDEKKKKQSPNKNGSDPPLPRKLSSILDLDKPNVNTEQKITSETLKQASVNGASDKGKSTTATSTLVQAEERSSGGVNLSNYLTYFRSASRGYGVLTGFILILSFCLAQVSKNISDLWIAKWSSTTSTSTDDYYIFWFGMISIGMIVFVFLRSFLFAAISVNASTNLHDSLFRSLMKASVPLFYDVTPLGRVLNRFSKDLDSVDVLLPDYFSTTLQNVIQMIAALIVSFFSSFWALVFFVIPAIIFNLVQNYFRKTSREVKRLESISRSPIYSSFGETLNGLSTIRAFRMQNTFIELNEALVTNNTRFFVANNMTARWLAVRLDVVSTCIIATMSLLLVVFRDSMDPGLAALALTYSLSFTGLLQYTVRTVVDCENAMTSVERLEEYSSITHEASAIIPAKSPPPSWPSTGAIELKNLMVRYRPGLDLVLKGVSCSIRPKEKIGVCGRTGAGKSSLMVALFRVVECEEKGSIVIDGIDVTGIGLKDLRSKLSIIPQDPVLFSGSLRYNLDPFNEHSDEELWQALHRVHLADPVKNLPEKLAFRVAEYGENFSHGQRQLICIARALLRKSRIIVMDEATASVDSETDALIQQTIRDSFSDCTVLSIAHRLDTIIYSSRIMVLDKGKMAEFDTPVNLLSKPAGEGAIFRGMVEKGGKELYNQLYSIALQNQAKQQ